MCKGRCADEDRAIDIEQKIQSPRKQKIRLL